MRARGRGGGERGVVGCEGEIFFLLRLLFYRKICICIYSSRCDVL